MIAAAAALLLATTPAASEPPSACGEFWLFCDNALDPSVLRRFDLEPAQALADQGYVGVRIITDNGHGAFLPMVSVLRLGDGPATADVHDAGEPARRVTVSDATWQAAAKLSADLKAGPGSYSLKDPEAFCFHAWTFAIEVIDADGVTTRARDTCAYEQSGKDTQAFVNAVTDDFPGCERLSREFFQGIPAYRQRACLSLATSRRGVAADAVNAWQASPLGEGAAESLPPGEWLADNVVLDWPGKPTARGAATVARFWRIAVDEDSDRSPSDLGLAVVSARYQAARAYSDRRVRITGFLLQDDNAGGLYADFVQDWVLEDDGRWRLARWQVADFDGKRR